MSWFFLVQVGIDAETTSEYVPPPADRLAYTNAVFLRVNPLGLDRCVPRGLAPSTLVVGQHPVSG